MPTTVLVIPTSGDVAIPDCVSDTDGTSDGVAADPREAAGGSSRSDRLLLCYWNMRCLAQPARLALEYVCADFVDVRVECEQPDPADPGVSKRNWFRQKPGLRLPFGGNLPFLIDGGTGARLVQSNAILRYIGRKFCLLGDQRDWRQVAALDMLMEQLTDFDNDFVNLTYYKYHSVPGAKEAFVKRKIPVCVRAVAEALGSKPFLVCGTPTIVDFKAMELLMKYEVAFAPDTVSSTEGVAPAETLVVVEYLERMRSLPTLKKYLASDRCIVRPLNNPHAEFK